MAILKPKTDEIEHIQLKSKITKQNFLIEPMQWKVSCKLLVCIINPKMDE